MLRTHVCIVVAVKCLEIVGGSHIWWAIDLGMHCVMDYFTAMHASTACACPTA